MRTLFFFFVACVYSYSAVRAQASLDSATMRTCSCVAGADWSQVTTAQAAQLKLGVCLLSGAREFLPQLKKDLKIKDSNQEGMRQLGEAVGIRMAALCPDELMKISALMQEKNMAAESPVEEEDTEDVLSLDGKIVDIETTQFMTFIVEDAEGRVYKLLLLDRFEKSDKITLSREKNIGTTIYVEYKEREMYDPKISEYRSYKVIHYMEVK